jgi:hypothetical protein
VRFRRHPAPPPGTARALLVAAVAATAVLVPATARADGTPAPGDPVTTTVQGTVGALAGSGDPSGQSGAEQGDPSQQSGSQQGSGTQTPGTASGLGLTPGGTTTGDQTTSGTTAPDTPTGLPPLDLTQLNRLLGSLGVPAGCATSVEADLQKTVTDIPATAEQLLGEIVGRLGQGGLPTSPLALTDPATGEKVLMKASASSATLPDLSSPDPGELALVQDIQQLLTDLLTQCLPAPPTVAPPSSTSSAPVVAAPVAAQPVSYPGYAPTGGTGPAEPSSDGSPLAGLGAGLVLTGAAGVAWYRVRSRAARAQD